MSAIRAPRIGEVWTHGLDDYECVGEIADSHGYYPWTYIDDDGYRCGTFLHPAHLTAPVQP